MGDVTEVAIWLLMFSHLTGMGSLSVLSLYPNMANHQASDALVEFAADTSTLVLHRLLSVASQERGLA